MSKQIAQKALEQGKGVLRLAPAWVPRAFCRPGRRIKLHPGDAYCLGLKRGAIDERWLASTTPAQNGEGTPEDEGLSYVVADESGKEKVLLRDMVEMFKGSVTGDGIYGEYGRWPMLSKFFDNLGPLPHHVHHMDEHAALVGLSGKPEMYFFPAQMNNYPGEFAFTFFGLSPGTTRLQLERALRDFTKGDNRILELSRAYKLELDTGWDVPPGVLHAPGSLCTYEPQFASDVFAMYQSVLLHEHTVDESLLWKNCPEDKLGDFDYLISMLDWDVNTDPDFGANRLMLPVPAADPEAAAEEGYIDEWICYKCPEASAKRLTVLPGRSVRISDGAAYGFILVQGRGLLGGADIETPTLIRYGQLTSDEFFVTEQAAKEGVTISNTSKTEPLVMLKHYARNPELDIFIKKQTCSE